MEMQNLFQEKIKSYLDTRAIEDEQFAKAYNKENKSIKECCDYIESEVYKLAEKNGIKGMTDEAVYGLAIHYYDEEELSFTAHHAEYIVINEDIELTEEEKKELKEKAKLDFINDEKNKLRIQAENANKAAIQKAKEKAEKEKAFESKQMSLF